MAKRTCDNCQKDEENPAHTCPYQEAMAWEHEKEDLPLCNCCDDCQSNCAGDI